MLERVRYPDAPRDGEDGVSYHVSHWSTDLGFRSGQTWSPPEGSRPDALVNLSERMRAFAEAPSAQAEARLRSAATALLTRIK